ncbi:hypothetical protein ACJIZ3_002639 [Penstemon smallii]|uniref:Uncharacterized protein n=1 Tax=Penstemon smallii TaxID=265156 RepID=A0ABD3U8U5_9LAMI
MSRCFSRLLVGVFGFRSSDRRDLVRSAVLLADRRRSRKGRRYRELPGSPLRVWCVVSVFLLFSSPPPLLYLIHKLKFGRALSRLCALRGCMVGLNRAKSETSVDGLVNEKPVCQGCWIGTTTLTTTYVIVLGL